MTITPPTVHAGNRVLLYHVTQVDGHPGWQTVTDINDAGQVCGYVVDDPYVRAFVWHHMDGIRYLGTLGFGCVAESISNLGQVAGASGNENGDNEAFFWDPGSGIMGLGDLPGGVFSSAGTGINDYSEVTGKGYEPGPNDKGHVGFIWDVVNGMRSIGDLPGGQYTSIPSRINNHAWITGWSCTASGCPAFVWTPEDGMSQLPQWAVDGWGINNLGQIVGGGYFGEQFEAYVWDPLNGVTPLGPPNDETVAFDINDHGQIVGASRRLLSGVIWDADGGMHSLTAMLDASAVAPYDRMGEAVAINNVGQIVCRTWAPDDVVLTPFVLADMNCDGSLNSFDIQPFVLTLQWLSGDDAARQEYENAYPGCHGDWAADANQDGSVNQFDIQPFIDLLSG